MHSGKTRRRASITLLGCMLAVAASGTVMAPRALDAGATGPTVSGSGSSWVAIALDQWRADIAQQGYHINYSSVGSSVGRQNFAQGLTDFGASEIPYQPGEPHPSRAFEYLPDVAGGTSLMYNLHTPARSQINSLRLTADAAAKIFTGKITSWQDPEIQSLNPGLQISETTITPVVRSDGSGTSAQFSLYLASQAPGIWGPFAASQGCPAPCSLWPPIFQAQNGSDGVASFVANTSTGSGAIGYVEAGYAQGYGFPVAALHNVSGNYALPTAVDVATALQHAAFNADNTQRLDAVYVAPEPNAYPMSSYSYMIAQTSGFDPAKGATYGTWLIYIACGGQREAAPLGYSPLPPVLVQNVFAAEQRIPGAPPPPPIDKVHCPNPTIANDPGSPPAEASISEFGSGQHSSSGGAGAAATTAPSADATAGPSATSAASASAAGQSVATLSAAQREAALLAAEKAALNARPASALVFLVAGLVILAAVFVPVLAGWRRSAVDAEKRDG